jgi:hypothetical protein
LLKPGSDSKTLSLFVYSDPFYKPQAPNFIKGKFLGDAIREIGKNDNEEIFENIDDDIWAVGNFAGGSIKGKFKTEAYNVWAGGALISRENLKAGIFAGYEMGKFKHSYAKANFEGTQFGVYGVFLTETFKFKGLGSYEMVNAEAKNKAFSAAFGINAINFGVETAYQTGKIWSPYIYIGGAIVSNDKIAQHSDDFSAIFDANTYLTLPTSAGIRVKVKTKSAEIGAKGYIGYVLSGNDPDSSTPIQPLFFGMRFELERPISKKTAIFVSPVVNGNPDFLAYQTDVGLRYSF